jgi:transcriptional regulator with XRE-family HTH domain
MASQAMAWLQGAQHNGPTMSSPTSNSGTAWPTATPAAAPQPVGELIRQSRTAARISQMELALQVGISPRHLSFVETGRSRPGPEVLLALAQVLAVPLRERNAWLLAAGYAPRFAEHGLSSVQLAAVRRALQRLLAAHDPYPGLVLDRCWNVVDANAAAQHMVALLPPALQQPPINILRASLHPQGFAAATTNFAQWGAYVWQQVQALARSTRDPGLQALAAEIEGYETVRALRAQPSAPPGADGAPTVLVPCELAVGGQRLAMFTVLSRLGTALDVTLQELSVELFYPADEATEQVLQAWARGPG